MGREGREEPKGRGRKGEEGREEKG